MEIYKNQTILVTGGTGSFGKNFIKYLLKNSKAKKIIIFSRDEFKQFQMERELNDPRLRFFIGDVRELPRLERAFRNVDIIIHASALKQVPLLEYNPFEAVKTNILGTQNVVEAAINNKVKKVLLISTDKAAQPINLYGATKLTAEKLFISGNNYSGDESYGRFSVVRYGNVLGSRGSIIETLVKNKSAKTVTITDPEMTRFWITLEQAFDLVTFALTNMAGGEIIVPKIPSMKIADLFKAAAPRAKKKFIGLRPGEKMHETLLTCHEAKHALELEKYFVVFPEFPVSSKDLYQIYKKSGGKVLPDNFEFSSHTNSNWLTVQALEKILKKFKAE